MSRGRTYHSQGGPYLGGCRFSVNGNHSTVSSTENFSHYNSDGNWLRKDNSFHDYSRQLKEYNYPPHYVNPDTAPSLKRRKFSSSTWENSGEDYRPKAYNNGISTHDINFVLPAPSRPDANAYTSTAGKRDRSEFEVDEVIFLSRDDIERCSPSRKDGIDVLHETYLRYSYCAFLQNLGSRLDLPQTTVGTAMVLCHRFFVRRSHACHDRYLIATATLFLAAKSEETPRPLNDGWFELYQERVIEAEQLILTTLDFELNVQHPYVPLTSILDKLGLSKSVLVNLALHLISEGLRSSLWLQFKPHQIAAGAAYLAAKYLNMDLASCPNIWMEFQTPPFILEGIMLSNQFQNGIETAKLAWARLPSTEDGEGDEVVGVSGNNDGGRVESLDYEVVENHAYREEQALRGKLYVGYYVGVKWFFALLIGVGTGLAAVFINISVENFAGWKFSLTFSVIQKSYVAGFLLYILINLVLVFSSAFIITNFAPAAAGSGIPEIKGYLNGVDTHGILLFRTLIGKIFGSIGSVGGGLALGKEGPLVHTGACIASLLGQGGSTKYHLNSRWLQFFNSDRDRRDLVTCGCAAGVAAAFRAPVGGVLFALEEVTSWWRSQLMWRVFFTSAIVAVVVRTAMGWCKSGKCGHFGSGGFIIWDISGGQEDYSFEELLPMAVIGVIGGLLGALFNQLTRYITYWRRNYLHKKGNRFKIIEVCLISVITSVISFGLPLFRKCSPCPEADPNFPIECPRPPGMYGNYVNFYCGKDKEYNDLATIFFNTQDDAIRNLFSAKTIHEYSAQSLLTFLVSCILILLPASSVMFYTLAVVTFGTAVPAGQFVPGIMIGSTYGRLVGMFVVSFYKKLNIEEGTYALLGAASFLGGSMRMTVSLCVIMVEITNNLKLLPLIMLVLLISKAVGDAFNEGLYEEQARLRGIPLLESRPKYEMRKMQAKEACGNQKVVYFPRVIKVADVVSSLKSNNHNGFPVIDHTRSGETLVIGLVLRSHLLVLLQSKVDFQHSPLPCDTGGGSLPIRHNFSEFVKPASSKGISIHDIHLGPDDLEMYIDLAPFVNRSPYIVPEDMSLTKGLYVPSEEMIPFAQVYNLFRQLGLRHIFVVPRASRVIGMITRKDLLIEETEDPATVELQSTSVRDRLHNRRHGTRNGEVETPLLNGLLAQ
ncbi:hypothetical protein RHGRI_003429 [Rhododendron griersonianum]|uniref:Chloride channel protein n=1 Tax=Rhododendron griersonianum TaxID=479676 RepID=A0AAV6L5P5_9ERIC|nr:hypothetical protein RHGRI_003429 [Rhododendron griersonianum]